MKNLSLFIALLSLLFACQSEVKVEIDTSDVDEKFAQNCITVKSYLDDFVNESVDYDKYYNGHKIIINFIIKRK